MQDEKSSEEMVVMVAQYECTKYHWTIYFKMAKVVNFICILPQFKKLKKWNFFFWFKGHHQECDKTRNLYPEYKKNSYNPIIQNKPIKK